MPNGQSISQEITRIFFVVCGDFSFCRGVCVEFGDSQEQLAIPCLP